MVPLSGVSTALKMRISVDLPAPLSPTSPVICPAATSIETLSSATTPPKRLLMSSGAQRRRSHGRASTVLTPAPAPAANPARHAFQAASGSSAGQAGHGLARPVRPDGDRPAPGVRQRGNRQRDLALAPGRERRRPAPSYERAVAPRSGVASWSAQTAQVGGDFPRRYTIAQREGRASRSSGHRAGRPWRPHGHAS